MKLGRTVTVLGLVVAISATYTLHATAQDKASTPGLKIGVYDSRGIAIAWARSAEFGKEVAKLRTDLAEAKAKSDTALVRKLETEGRSVQVRLHQRGFSTAGAADLLERVADQLPAVAREAGVVLIVSKWELPYRDPAVEVVDVTLPVAKLFDPDEQTLKILGELAVQMPVPFDELPLDPND
jgi:hypothetical protein